MSRLMQFMVIGAVAAACASAHGQDFSVDSIVAGVKLTWEGEVGLEYVISWSPTLDPPVWQAIGKVLARASGPLSFFDSERTEHRGFYRIEKRRPMILVPGSDGGGVDYDFYIGKYEVTIAEFADFLGDPSTDRSRWLAYDREQKIIVVWEGKTEYAVVPLTGWEDRPIQHISWEAAAAFCNWLSEQEGLEKVYDEATGWTPDISKDGYRLPTSKEWYKAACWDPTKDSEGGFWEYGCHSDELRPSLANYGASGDPFEYGDPEVRTTPVGFYNGTTYRLYLSESADGHDILRFRTEDAKSYYGCYDIEGNVSEFVMIESDGAYHAGEMGSPWPWGYPYAWQDYPTSEPRDVRYTEINSWSGFRLARTAP